MKGKLWKTGVVFSALFGLLVVLLTSPSHAQEPEYTQSFEISKCDFSSTGRNTYFVLEPGYKLVLEGEEEGEQVHLEVTVLNETEMVDGAETRVVEERELHNGELAEVSRNFYAICRQTNSVFYFGEDTYTYENGQPVFSPDDSWRAGEEGAKPGVMMPGIVLLGSRYYQEVAPDVAMDRVEHVSMSETVETPAGTFSNCLKTRETTPLEPDAEEFKYYAPGIGIVQDETLKLVSSSLWLTSPQAGQTLSGGPASDPSSFFRLSLLASGFGQGESGEVFIKMAQPAATYYYVGPGWSTTPSPVGSEYRDRLFKNGEIVLYGKDNPVINDGWIPPSSAYDCSSLPDGEYTFTVEYHIQGEVHTSSPLSITLNRGCSG